MATIDLSVIKKRRLELGISLDEMAVTLGLKDKSNYFKYENGSYKLRAEQLPAICNKLNLEISALYK